MMNKEQIVAGYRSLLENNTDPKKYFHKKKYAAYFEEYIKNYEETFKAIDEFVAGSLEEETNSLFDEMTAGLAACAKEQTDALGRMKRENKKSELNLFMVTSVFPCILKLSEANGEKICNAQVAAWKKAFDGIELGFTTYEKLCDSFRGFFSFLTGR